MELTYEEQNIYDQVKSMLWFMTLSEVERATDIKEKYPNVWSKLSYKPKLTKEKQCIRDIENELQNIRCQMYADTTMIRV